MSFQLSLLNLLMRWQVKRRFRKNPDVQLLRPVMLQMEPRMSKLPAGIAASARRSTMRSAKPSTRWQSSWGSVIRAARRSNARPVTATRRAFPCRAP